MNDVLSESEIADLLDCDVELVRAMAKRGELPALKIGRKWRFPRSAILQFLHELGLQNMARAETQERPKGKRRDKSSKSTAKNGRLIATINFHASKRRAATLKRTVAWADMEQIKAIYRQAQALTVATGIKHHVDHVIPLQGVYVSGLHVETNLQILTAFANIGKKNKYEADL